MPQAQQLSLKQEVELEAVLVAAAHSEPVSHYTVELPPWEKPLHVWLRSIEAEYPSAFKDDVALQAEGYSGAKVRYSEAVRTLSDDLHDERKNGAKRFLEKKVGKDKAKEAPFRQLKRTAGKLQTEYFERQQFDLRKYLKVVYLDYPPATVLIGDEIDPKQQAIHHKVRRTIYRLQVQSQ
jgi:hypothetical protein